MKKPRLGLIIALVTLVVVLIIGSVVAIAAVNNNQVIANTNAQATTTAQKNAGASVTAQNNAGATATANVQATAQAQAQATASVVAANPDPYPFGGQISLIDPLRTNNSSEANWDEGSTNVGVCSFNNAAYHVTSTRKGTFKDCPERNVSLQNFVLELQMTITQGDCGGILFRANLNIQEFYQWEVCRDGAWRFYTYFNGSGGMAPLPKGTYTPLSTNTLAIVANGSQIVLYINGQQMNNFTNATYTSGNIALIATDRNNSTSVTYTSLRVWTL